MKKTYQIPALKTYQIPALNKNNVFNNCQLLIGTTIPSPPERKEARARPRAREACLKMLTTT